MIPDRRFTAEAQSPERWRRDFRYKVPTASTWNSILKIVSPQGKNTYTAPIHLSPRNLRGLCASAMKELFSRSCTGFSSKKISSPLVRSPRKKLHARPGSAGEWKSVR